MKLTLLLIFLTSATLCHAEPETKSPESPRVVVVFGDSITAGSALPNDQKEQAWIRVVEHDSNGKLKMVNEGKGGRPTQSVPEFEGMLKRQKTIDELIIALGTNDSRDITADCVPKAVANLRKMIELFRKAFPNNPPILLVGPPNINKSALGPTKPIGDKREEKLRELSDGFQALAKELGCDYLSLFGALPEGSMKKDGVHPDPTGNEAIAERIEKKLLP